MRASKRFGPAGERARGASRVARKGGLVGRSGQLALLGLASLLLGCSFGSPVRAPAGVARPSVLPTLAPRTGTPTPMPTTYLTATATRTATAVVTPSPAPTEEPLALTILYDNYAINESLRTGWGYACLLERGDLRILFDTGADALTLLANTEGLGVETDGLDAIILSHNHSDHVGGLDGILASNHGVSVYAPQAFAPRLAARLGDEARVIAVEEAVSIAPGVYTTGEMGRSIAEQALVVETSDGLVVITGCAHPGIVEMVAQAQQVAGGPVDLVIGGFHLSGEGATRIGTIIEDLRGLGVRRVAPTHCSGDLARRLFAEAYGDDYVEAGVGLRLQLAP